MDVDLFVYEMKKLGYRTPKQRADAMGVSLSAYYRRVRNQTECTLGDVNKLANLLGWDLTERIFFTN